MKSALAAAIILAAVSPLSALAAPPGSGGAAVTSATAASGTDETPRFTVNTPIETLVADPRAKAVLDRDMPGLTTDDNYDKFKAMSLHQLQPLSGGQMTDRLMARVAGDLAGIATQTASGDAGDDDDTSAQGR